MNDLISRQAAIDALQNEINQIKQVPKDDITIAIRYGVVLARNIIKDLPEIIRCKECKHWREGEAYSYCKMLFNTGVLDVYDYMREEDDYCSFAERREDED